jgi:Flp pilus assembly protein TadG
MTPSRNSPTARARRCHGDDGSVFAEFALILPLLAGMLMGMVELGVLFRQQNEFVTLTQLAARTAAQAGTARGADQSVLTAIRAGMSGLTNTKITKVIVYNADVEVMPTNACRTEPVNPTSGAGKQATDADCNIYTLEQINAATSSTNFTTGCAVMPTSGTTWDKWYCPINRRDRLATSPSRVGVYVEADYEYITKFFGIGPKKVTEHAVYQVEVLS